MSQPVDFSTQYHGQVATPEFINALADQVEQHDAALIDWGAGVMTGIEVRTTATLASVTTTEAAITNMSVAAYVKAGRRYTITAKVRFQSTVAGDELVFRLRDGSLTGTILGEDTGATAKTANTGYIRLMRFTHEPTASANRTFVLTAARLVGSGTCTVIGGGATNPTHIEVRDDCRTGLITKVT